MYKSCSHSSQTRVTCLGGQLGAHLRENLNDVRAKYGADLMESGHELINCETTQWNAIVEKARLLLRCIASLSGRISLEHNRHGLPRPHDLLSRQRLYGDGVQGVGGECAAIQQG